MSNNSGTVQNQGGSRERERLWERDRKDPTHGHAELTRTLQDLAATNSAKGVQSQSSPWDESLQMPPVIAHKSQSPHSRQWIISPEEDIRRLFQECESAQQHAGVLTEALLVEHPSGLEQKVGLCRASQAFIYSQIPWATASAARSRAEGNVLGQDGHTSESESTLEEVLLAALLAAHEASSEALRLYDDPERTGVERAEDMIQRELGPGGRIYAPTKILPIQVGNADERPANNAVRTSQTWLEQQQRKYMYRDDIDSDDFEGSQWSGEQCPPYTYDAMTYEPFFDDKSHSPDKSHQAPPDSGHAPAARIQPYPQDKITPRPAPHSQHDIVLPDENIRCMFQECEVAHGRAGLLSEVLVHENPDNLELKVSLCRASQELIYAHIPLVTASAERSRTERRNSVKDGSTSEPTLEEDLLSALLAANEASLEALCMHDDHELIGVERVMPGMVSPTSSHYGQHQHLADKPIPGSTTITPLIADDSSAERARPSPVAAAVAEGELTGRIRRVSLRWLEQHRKTLYVNVIESDTFEGPQWVRDKCTDYIYDPKIYQSLTIYTFSHLAHCVGDPSLLSAFHDHINEWQGWDVFQSLKYHRAIRDSLCALLLKSEDIRPLCQLHMANEVDGSELPVLDLQVIACHLAATLDDSDPSVRTFKAVFALRGKEARSMVDLLHTLVENPAIDSIQKALFANALVQLSKRACCYPESLVLEDIKIDTAHPVVTGAYSEVWKGFAQGHSVAVKKVRMLRSDLEDILKDCAREAIIWSRLSHPNLLPFYGIFYLDDERSRISLISPWMEHGHVGEYLERFPRTDRELLALDISSGVEYLHTCTPKVVHGDLKPRNILVTPSGTACLADFGLAYAKDPQRQTLSSTQGPTHGGTLAYEAPEMFDGEPVSFAADVYALGCVIYEMYSGVRPFHGLRDGAVIKAVGKGKRPDRPTGISDWMWTLVESCWCQEPTERPLPSNVVRQLGAFTADRARRVHDWDDSSRIQIRGVYSVVDHPASPTFGRTK